MEYLGWSYNGLTFGNGTSIAVVETTGFDDLPPIRAADLAKSGAHGSYAGLDLMGERAVVIKLALLGVDRPSYDTLVQQVTAAFSPQPLELPLLCGDSGNRRINCRPRKLSAPRKQPYHGTWNAEVQVELVATDPRIYTAAATVLTTGLAAGSGGMTFPAMFPISFGSAGAGGTVAVTNAGNFATDATYTVTGPLVNPVIDNITTGLTLQLGITLASGDSLVLDTNARSVILNGTASRTSALLVGSAWWSFPPGTTLLRFRNSGGFTASVLTVTFRSAWLALASGGA